MSSAFINSCQWRDLELVNLKNSVEFFPSRSSGALRAAYTLENLARIALGFRPAAAGNPGRLMRIALVTA